MDTAGINGGIPLVGGVGPHCDRATRERRGYADRPYKRVAADRGVTHHPDHKRWPSRRVRPPRPTWEQIAGDDATLAMLRQIIDNDTP